MTHRDASNRGDSSMPTTSLIQDNGCRVCPTCGTSEEIAGASPLWPLDWRCRHCGFALDVKDGFARLAPELDEVDEGFALESYETLRAMEDDHFWFTTRNELIEWLVRRFAASAKRVLEIGCGTGFTLFALREALPDARIAGSELHSRGLAHARRRHGQEIELLQMDARRSGVTEALDLVAAFDVLEHIADDAGVLREIWRMLKPGGFLIATVPQHPWLWSAADEIAHHQRRYKIGELASKARTAELRIRYSTSFATLAFPLMAAARLRTRTSSGESATSERLAAESHVPPTINTVLSMLFRAEHGLRRVGIPLPFGGSQIVVAEKPVS